MILKERSEPTELIALRYLNARMNLTEKEEFHYQNLEKGYEGELKFDLLVQNLSEERYIINDLLLEINNSYFQIDSLIISQEVVHLFDIKNFIGDCYLESNNLYSMKTKREYKNPVDQLKRSTTLFRQLLQNHRQNFLIDASVIYINQEFTLYQAPMDQPIILPTQLNRLLNELNHTPSKLNEGHKKLAQKLISLHQTENPFSRLPEYQYDALQKGMCCSKCMSLQVFINNYDLVCKNCGEHEKMESAVLRHTKEFKLLFPEQRITTRKIYEWCNVDVSTRTISRILKKNLTTFGTTSNTYFE